jgi:DNA (cytosine-5)-methyltransferase 1
MTTAPGGGIALIAPYYGSGSGETCNSADEPLPTVTSKGRFGMVVPVTHSKGSNQARNISQPLPTMTTAKGGEFALVLPVTHEGGHDRVLNAKTDPLPTVTGANRGELAFIEGGQQYDILFRMLDEDELAAAMGLEEYEFTGTKTERVKQVGNAVSRRKMQACVRSIMADDAAAFSMAAE